MAMMKLIGCLILVSQPVYAAINFNGDGSVTFTPDCMPCAVAPQIYSAAQWTPATLQSLYTAYEATWPLSYWQAVQTKSNYDYMVNFVNLPQLIDGGTLTNETGTTVAAYLAAVVNNYRTIKQAIAACASSACVIAINVTSGYPANP